MQELWWVWMRRCYVPSRFWNQPRRRPSTHMAGWMRDGLWHPRASQRRRIARYRTKEVMQGGPNCPIVLLTRHNLNPSISLILYHGPHFLLVTSPNFLLLSHSFVGFRFPFPSVFVLCLLFHCFFLPLGSSTMTHDMMIPYNLLYAILPQVWLLHGAGFGQWKG